MKNLPSLLLTLAASFVLSSPAEAQDRALLEPTAGFKPAFSMSESRTDAFVLVKDPFDSSITTPAVQTTMSSTFSFTANLESMDIATFDEQTRYSVSVGGFGVGGVLGDDPAYVKGKKSVSIGLGMHPVTNAPAAPFLKMSWTAKVLTVSISISTKGTEGPLMPIHSLDQDAMPHPKLFGIVPVNFEFNNVPCYVVAYVKGSSTYAEKMYQDNPYPLYGYRVTAVTDVTPPVLTVKFPAKGMRYMDGLAQNFFGTCADPYGLWQVQVCDAPNDPLGTWSAVGSDLFPMPEDPPWGPLSANWSHQLTESVGEHVYGFRAVDRSGNVSAVVTVPFTVIPVFNALAPSGSFKPAIKVTASVVDRTVVSRDGDVTIHRDAKGTLTLTANLDGIDTRWLYYATPCGLELNGASVSGMLGDDPAYGQNKTAVTFVREQEYGKTTIKMSWTAKLLTATVTLAANGPAASVDLDLFGFLGAGDGTAHPDLRLVLPLTASLDQHNGASRIYASLKSTMTTKTIGGNDYPLANISVTGANDAAPPVMTVTEPVNNGAQTGASVFIRGGVTEGCNLALLEWSADFDSPWSPPSPVTFADASPPRGAEDQWGAVTGTWEAEIPLPFGGGGLVYVRATDEAGNVSKPVALTWHKPLALASLAGKWQGLLQRGARAAADPAVAAAFAFGRVTMTSTATGTVSGKLAAFPLMSTDASFSGVLNETAEGAEFLAKVTLKADLPVYWLKGTVMAGADAQDHVMALILTDQDPAEPSLVAAEGNLTLTPFTAAAPVPVALRGLYNAAITMPPAAGVGEGFFGAAVAANGTVTLSGKLADGTALTWSGPLGGAFDIAMVAPLYAGKGGAAGRLSLTNGVTKTLGCDRFTWLRPAGLADKQLPLGIDAEGTAAGALYVPALNLADYSTLTFETTADDANLAYHIVLNLHPTTGAIQIPSPNPDQFKVTFAPATGLLTGSYRTLDAKGAAFSALFLPDGAGSFHAQGYVTADPEAGQAVKRQGSVAVELGL